MIERFNFYDVTDISSGLVLAALLGAPFWVRVDASASIGVGGTPPSSWLCSGTFLHGSLMWVPVDMVGVPRKERLPSSRLLDQDSTAAVK